jgi:cytochrome c oxidase subunit 3
MSTDLVPRDHAHHFDSDEQEFDACKIGMWLFLVTEVMFFGGLFMAYAAFRIWYPDMWLDASRYILDWEWGALNTIFLIVSSYTMVMAVHAAQTSDVKKIRRYLVFTFLLASLFMVVKTIEYTAKFKHHSLPATRHTIDKTWGEDFHLDDPVETAIIKSHEHPNIFMGLYFIMTGIHGLHVLIGMFLMIWLYVRAGRGQFHKDYFTPVEMVGLFWHVVDLIWIFLFPLFYLVG